MPFLNGLVQVRAGSSAWHWPHNTVTDILRKLHLHLNHGSFDKRRGREVGLRPSFWKHLEYNDEAGGRRA